MIIRHTITTPLLYIADPALRPTNHLKVEVEQITDDNLGVHVDTTLRGHKKGGSRPVHNRICLGICRQFQGLVCELFQHVIGLHINVQTAFHWRRCARNAGNLGYLEDREFVGKKFRGWSDRVCI